MLKLETTFLFFTFLAFSALNGCTTENPGYESYEDCSSETVPVRQQFSLADPYTVDILFVIDNGPGMSAFQQRLARAMPSFVEALSATALDWRVGVTSSDMHSSGAQGALQIGSSCEGSAAMLEDGGENIAEALACNVQLGEQGSGFRQGLAAAIEATRLDGPNPGFVREGSRLVIINFSSHDDCSFAENNSLDQSDPNNCVWQNDTLESVENLIATLQQNVKNGDDFLVGEPISFVAINAPSNHINVNAPDAPNPVCNAPDPAFAGNRYQKVIETLGVLGETHNICASDYSDILINVVQDAIKVRNESICVEMPMIGAPQMIRMIDELGPNAEEEIILGRGDYLHIGPTDACENGAIAIATNAHDHLPYHIAEVFFCRADE